VTPNDERVIDPAESLVSISFDAFSVKLHPIKSDQIIAST
jgi:hypothetical protein